MKSRHLQNNTSTKEGKPMKPIAILSLFAALLLVSCSATKSGKTVYDDVYFSPNDPVVHVREIVVTTTEKQEVEVQQEYYQDQAYGADPIYDTPYAETEYYTDPQGHTVINNYFYGDYYDYSYASRIKRFHRNYGFDSYYHDFYTNMYWYNRDPFYWGRSIYMGYGYYPWGSFFPHSFGWGWPSRSFWSVWYNPYFMFGFGYPHFYHGWYSSYWRGYRHGFWDGYFGYPFYGDVWYMSSRDQNSYFYGPRTGFASNTGSGTMGGGSGRPLTVGQGNEKAIPVENPGRSVDHDGRGSRPDPSQEGISGSRTGEGTGRPVVADQLGEAHSLQQEPERTGTRESVAQGRTEKPVANPAEGRQSYQRPVNNQSEQGNRTVAPNQRLYQFEGSRRTSPAYTRPDEQRNQPQQAQPQRQPQPYSSPRYTKPKTSEEFTSPAFRNPRDLSRPVDENLPQRDETSPQLQRPVQQQAAPHRQTSPQTSPGREQQSQPRYSPPSRPNVDRQSTPPPRSPSYSTPPRSSSPPASRTPSFSAPSRSSSPPASRTPSFSAPSRSSSPPASSPKQSAPSRSGGGGGSSSSSSSSGRGNR